MPMLLMPQATAVWLIDNTTLTFEQIAAFVGLHDLQVQAIADGEIAKGMPGDDPVLKGQLTAEEIARCEADPEARLELAESLIPDPVPRKGPRYTPIAKRQNKPDAIAWILQQHPEVSDAQIQRLIGTTKPTITKIREGTHQNMPNIQPTHPLELGLCTREDFLAALEKAQKAQERVAKREAAAARKAARQSAGAASPEPASSDAAPPDTIPPDAALSDPVSPASSLPATPYASSPDSELPVAEPATTGPEEPAPAPLAGGLSADVASEQSQEESAPGGNALPDAPPRPESDAASDAEDEPTPDTTRTPSGS